MATLTLRSSAVAAPLGFTYTTKGAPLTYLEIDNNFINLDIEIHQNRDDIDYLLARQTIVNANQPTNPAIGQLWHDLDALPNPETFLWDGTQWVNISRLKYIDNLFDVIAPGPLGPPLQDQGLLAYDAAALDAAGRQGQWTVTYIIDGSPDAGATNDF